MAPIPITIITGFLGSGKTTILLNLIPQLPPSYRLALLKNEFGDLAVDSQLASTSSISGVRELLNGCICCNLVGQLSDALVQLRTEVLPDRIVIETSGSAFPATLAMEVNRLARELPGESFVLDGVISVIDVENWQGYEDTSYTAKLQAQYTDLIIFNKWETCDEMRFEICLDRLGDLELQTAWVKSDKGRVEKDILLGTDGALLSKELERSGAKTINGFAKNGEGRAHAHDHAHDHQSEVEVLSVSLAAPSPAAMAKLSAMEDLLLAAPKDEVYRIKGIIRGSTANPPTSSSGERAPAPDATTAAGDADGITQVQNYILNWAFGRWTFTPSSLPPSTTSSSSTPGSGGNEVVRLTLILARHESAKWKKKLENGGLVEVDGEPSLATLTVTRIL